MLQRLALVLALLLAVQPLAARDVPRDLEAAWQTYIDQEAHAEPAYVFPHRASRRPPPNTAYR